MIVNSSHSYEYNVIAMIYLASEHAIRNEASVTETTAREHKKSGTAFIYITVCLNPSSSPLSI